ncbi:hypothetical protein N7448_009120 [Penicillium atrosanguineum]|uniref:Uncharacterized protein n=1 Tax=Penicillium atrosanguineum TaxID=1132637 RepID=A0A9W9U6M6_9EURO|nr:uncharacterized protein N7443_006365 [Penicillium atrosanguineum]KAJ5123023.1 hypothetical protein N7448_009120 [Penicillium atrosanguineum]KAJ5141654.1 hypothetical protein N7526_002649 [Penicillium atrosanguineum]KAJ5298245.1 hypothetical protein N7443_006365 [Penicillium atrosanguineum]KAJ5321488.1 hypothetical protein N7476_004490 [Penicillium atrosanguineum]
MGGRREPKSKRTLHAIDTRKFIGRFVGLHKLRRAQELYDVSLCRNLNPRRRNNVNITCQETISDLSVSGILSENAPEDTLQLPQMWCPIEGDRRSIRSGIHSETSWTKPPIDARSHSR